MSFYQRTSRLPETLPEDVLQKMHAPPKSDKYQVLEDPSTLEAFDGFLFGIPTRYGNFPAQYKVCESKTHSSCQLKIFYPIARYLFTNFKPELLGQDRWPMAKRRLLGQVCRRVHLDRLTRRWPRVHCSSMHEHIRSPRHHLRAFGLRQGLRPAYGSF